MSGTPVQRHFKKTKLDIPWILVKAIPYGYRGVLTDKVTEARLELVIDSGLGTTRAEDAQGTPTQGHISPSILVYEDIISAL